MKTICLLEVANGVLSIASEVESALAEMSKMDSSLTLFQYLFNYSSESKFHHFFDTLLGRYFQATQTTQQRDDYKNEVSCFLAAACLADADTFVRFVIDLYADKNERADITMTDCRLLLEDIFTDSQATARAIEENLQELSQYASSIAATGSVFDSASAEHVSNASLGVDEPFPKSIAEHFYTRKRKNGLWPLEVFHNQVKMKFLGLSYWHSIRPDALLQCELLPSKFPDMSMFAAALKTAVESVKDLKSSLVNHSQPETDIVETDGIFMYRRRVRTKRRVSGSKQKKLLLMTGGSDLTDDMETDSLDRFVTSEIATSHRHHFPVDRAISPSCSSRTSSPPISHTRDGSPVGGFATLSSSSSPGESPVCLAEKSSSCGNLDCDMPPPPVGASPTLTSRLSSAMSHLCGLRVLVIEDSLFQRKLMTKRLNTVRPSQSSTPDSAKDEYHSDGGSSGGFERPLRPPSSPGSCTGSPTQSGLVRSVPHRGGGFSGFGHPELPATVDGSVKSDAWNVTDVSNGEEAIRLIINNKEGFDVIFVDENLQGSGGYLLGHEVVRILRGHHSLLPSCIIIGCSTNAQKYANAFLEAGADAVWKKPLPTDNQIITELCKYLALRE